MSQSLASQKNSFQIDEFYIDLQSDGKTISLLSEEQIKLKPFPGLRPFKTSEFQLFKGRDGQAEELLKRLKENHFLAVIGSSGTGKSSLVRAALIPQLFGGFLQKAGSKWKIAICRPGKDPVKNLSVALASIASGKTSGEELMKENEIIEPLLRNSAYGLLDVNKILKQNENPDDPANLLIIIDQFEELFRFDRKELKVDGAAQLENDFIQLLLKATSGIDANIYVILTMRSEFLGDCVKYRGLPEIINKSQYLVPQLTRRQLREVIELPVIRAGKKISPDLIEILINEIESEKLKENLDQLPILQHALMRTYAEAFKPGSGNTEMLYKHYESIGGMKEALARHAKEVFDSLADKDAKGSTSGLSRKQRIAKIIFQALTDATSDQKGGRRPTELQNIYDILKTIKVGKEETDEVINYFRYGDTSFIMPPSNTKLYPGLMLDISHESLMRNWPDLKNWMKEEVEAAVLYERLNQSRFQYEGEQNEYGKSETYIRGILLADLKEWRNSELYNEAWAKRYQKTELGEHIEDDKALLYKRNLAYLKTCEKEVDKEKRRKRNANIVLAGIAMLAIIASTVAFTQTKKANTALKDKAIADSLKALGQIARQQDLIKFQKQQAETAKQRAIDSVNTITMQAESKLKEAKALAQLKAAQAEAFYQAEIAKAEKAKNDAEKEARERILALTKENFYQSPLLEQDKKDEYVISLIDIKYNLGDDLRFSKLLRDLNAIEDIKQTAQDDPNSALIRADQAYDSSGNIFRDFVLHFFAGNYFFYTEDTTFAKDGLDYNYTRGISAISASRKLFAVKLDDTIKVFRLNNDGISFFKKIQIDPYRPNSDTIQYSYNEITGPNTMTFINEDSLIALINNKIYRININNAEFDTVLIPDLNKENVYERYYASTISPDGKKLAIDYKDYNVKIFDIEKTYDSLKIALDQAHGFVENVDFSMDNSTIIVKQRDKYKVLNTTTLNNNTDLASNKAYICASFTPENKYIIVQPRSGVLELHDLKKDSLISAVNFSDIGIDTFKNTTATSLVLSPDWKKLFIKTSAYQNSRYSSNTYYFQRNDKDSIFRFTRKVTSKNSESGRLIKLNYINNSRIFLNDENLLSLNSGYFGDSVRLWQKYDTITSKAQLSLLADKISAVTNTEDKFGDLSINVDAVTNIEELAAAADMAVKKDAKYLQKETLYDAKKVYGRLAELDAQKYLYDYRRLSRNYYSYYADTAEYIKDLKKIVAAEEIQIKTNLSDTLKQDIASDYWNLSWFLLFAKKYDSAIYCANRGFEFNPKNNGINTNLAVGYLLNGECEKSNTVYKMYKGGKYASDERDFTESFLQDLDDLENAGIIKQENKIIYEHVQKVRRFLRGEAHTLDCKNSE